MSLRHLKLVNVLFVLFGILGYLTFFSVLPSKATTYTINLGGGSNPAHQGNWTVDVTYDPKTQKVTFKIVNGTGKRGQNTWDGWTYTVPATIKDGIVTFDGMSDIPTKADGTPANPGDKVTFVGATLNTATQELIITEVTNTAGTARFPIKSINVVKPPKRQTLKGRRRPARTNIPEKGLSFNSLTQSLAITGSTVVSSPSPVDSLLGSDVTYPNFSLTGFNAEANAHMFVNQNLLNSITLANTTTVFQTSTISALYYNVSQDLFYGVSLNHSFDPVSSSFIDYVSSVLDPTKSLYDPLAAYYVEIEPEVNFYELTQGFQMTNATGARDYHFLWSTTTVPESTSTLSLLALGTLGAASTFKRKLKPFKSTEKETTKVG